MNDTVVLKRGPFGGESLYYGRARDGWVTGDQLGRLARSLAARVDYGALARRMAYLEEPSTQTIFAGIHRVLPCETVELRRTEVVRTMTVPPNSSEPSGSLDALSVALLEHVTRAVNRATANSRCTGIMVGGLDSCGLAAVALTQARATIKLVTLDCEGGDPDRPYVNDLAKMYGVELLERTVMEGASHLESLLVVDGAFGLPPGGVIETVATQALREAGADCVLNGFMGDDVFGGDLRMIGRRVFPSKPIEALLLALRMRTPGHETIRQRLMNFLVLPQIRELLPRWVRRQRRQRHFAQRFSWTKPAFLELLEPSADRQEAVYRAPRNGEDLFRLRATSVPLADAADMRRLLRTITGLPRVDPILDLDLVRFASNLPFEALNCDNMFRGLYRRALGDLVPASVRARTGKSDVNWQILAIVRREFARPQWRLRFSLPQLTSLGWVDPIAFRRTIENLSSPDELNATWPFLAADAFLQTQA